jgi:2Fe-2S ferredoxin
MAKITYIACNGAERTAEVKPGWSVMEGAVKNNITGIVAECGGSMSCGTCHVWIDEAWRERIGPAKGGELELLEISDNFRGGSRCACQIKVTDGLDGLVVRTPESQP